MQKKAGQKPEHGDNLPVAVIDIGSSSVRMSIAQKDTDGSLRTLESLQQEVRLGKDTFAKGEIGRATMEECVRALKSFGRVLEEYGISGGRQLRAVATSAVREADNRDAFLDRIFVATGINVEAIDEAEEARFTYLSAYPILTSHPALRDSDVLIMEVGGGSTEVLLTHNAQVTFSKGYRLGSFRMLEGLEQHGPSNAHLFSVLENQIRRTVEQVRRELSGEAKAGMLALGGDARFAASQLVKNWDKTDVARIPVSSLDRFARGILEMSVDDLVKKYHLSYPDAEVLGPSLLTYSRFASDLHIKNLLVSSISMRDGIMLEMTADKAWASQSREQIWRSALDLGRKYEFDMVHGEHTAALCRVLFEALGKEHKLAPRYELILAIAGLLHDIGQFVGGSGHHKHSMYLMQNSNIFGLGARDLLLASLVARYHRKAFPKPLHEGYVTLGRNDRIAVSKMAAILRIADGLDRSNLQRVKELDISINEGRLVLTAKNVADLTLEQLAMRQKGKMFQQVFGMEVILRKARASR